MSRRNALGVISVFAVLLAGLAAGHSQSDAGKATKTGSGAPNQVQHISLPSISPDIQPGPNVDVYRKNCLMCHTARYVSTQPRFPKSVWQNEVKKMGDAYGAQISESDQALIVEYLVAVKGIDAPASGSAPTK